MYIWIGCKLPEDFEAELRQCCLEANADIGADTVAFSLPQHISLKISFDAGEQTHQILDFLSGLLQKERKFYVNLESLEQTGNILWLTVQEDPRLRRLHDHLDRLLLEEFSVKQHPYDRDFKFHSTLFIDKEEKLRRLHERLRPFPLPRRLPVEDFCLGVSETGKAGDYRVVRHVKIS